MKTAFNRRGTSFVALLEDSLWEQQLLLLVLWHEFVWHEELRLEAVCSMHIVMPLRLLICFDLATGARHANLLFTKEPSLLELVVGGLGFESTDALLHSLHMKHGVPTTQTTCS